MVIVGHCAQRCCLGGDLVPPLLRSSADLMLTAVGARSEVNFPHNFLECASFRSKGEQSTMCGISIDEFGPTGTDIRHRGISFFDTLRFFIIS